MNIKIVMEISLENAVRMAAKEGMEGREIWISNRVVHRIIDGVILEGDKAIVIEYKGGKKCI